MMRKIMAVGFVLILSLCCSAANELSPSQRTWMTVDLVSGIVSYHDYDFTTATNVFNTEEYKSSKMAFRRVQVGDDYYVQNGAYTAQMTNSYYIGLFEVTGAQYALMKNPAAAANGLKAQGKINRTAVRGVADAPAAFGADITAESPLGIMNANLDRRSCAKGVFDLPTEAMWEVAARAIDSSDETHSDWNWFFGKTADDIAQYAFLKNDTTDDGYGNTSGARVPGARLPNAWGLYDVYGNHYDLCLDGADGNNSPECKQGNWTEATNIINTKQRTRGGSFSASTSNDANSLYRSYHDSGSYDDTGFRLARICTPEEEDYYTATWADEDGTPLGPAETYVAGRTPRYTGALPTKPSANGVDYYFAGWTPEPSRLVSNTVYRAVFHAAAKRTWMDLDLRSGIVTYHDYDFATATNVFNTELYKTERMAFRRVECGDCYFVQNGVYTAQMTNSYYIGLFEVTEAQYALMKNPSAAANGLKAQGMINRTAVRGVGQSSAAFGADITPESPLGVMNANLDRRSCAKGVFDLPTEAMWEVAARAVDSAGTGSSGRLRTASRTTPSSRTTRRTTVTATPLVRAYPAPVCRMPGDSTMSTVTSVSSALTAPMGTTRRPAVRANGPKRRWRCPIRSNVFVAELLSTVQKMTATRPIAAIILIRPTPTPESGSRTSARRPKRMSCLSLRLSPARAISTSRTTGSRVSRRLPRNSATIIKRRR